MKLIFFMQNIAANEAMNEANEWCVWCHTDTSEDHLNLFVI